VSVPARLRKKIGVVGGGIPLSLMIASGVAGAAGPQHRLEWETDASEADCQGAEARVIAATRARLSYEPFASAGTRVVEARLSKSGQSHLVRLRFLDAQGRVRAERELESRSADCRVVLEAAALAIALAIVEATEHDAAGGDDEASVPASPEPVRPAASKRPSSMRAPPRERQEAPGPAGRLGASLVLATGALPGLAPGLDIGGRLRAWRNVYVSAGMSHFPELASHEDPRIALGLTVARGGACFAFVEHKRADVSFCAHVALGATHAVVEKLEPRSPGSSYFAIASPAGLFAYVRPWRAFAVGVGQELGVPIPRYRLIVEGSRRAVFDMSYVIGTTYFGIAFTSD
jgi:hypothetical protein